MSTIVPEAVLPPERRGHEAAADLVARRSSAATMAGLALAGLSPAPREQQVGERPTLRFTPATPSDTTIIHFHGGGFRQGCPGQVAGYAARLAARSGAEIICPTYRLAPEHPFPSGLLDGWSVIAALARESGRRLILAGDSAGAGIAAALALLCVRAAVPLAGLILHSPWLDLTLTSAGFEHNAAHDPLFSRSLAQAAAQAYLQGHDPRDPFASPLFAAPHGFPPTLLTVGLGEVLADDSLRFEQRLKQQGIAVRLVAIDGMDHVAVVRDGDLPGAPATFAATVAFLASLKAEG
ncbi:MAG TPA: alpha/beta hydrolase fold domain-containing protein [Sphingobium sp.]|nr:alpha/beta hydrolase fold domain-containing protein [Sphingobium sp.]